MGLSRLLVDKKELALFNQSAQQDFTTLRQDITDADRRDFEACKFDQDNCEAEVNKMKSGLRDEFANVLESQYFQWFSSIRIWFSPFGWKRC